MDSLTETLGKHRKESQELQEIEKKDNDAEKIIDHLWAVSYGERTVSYGQDFDNLVPERDFLEHLKNKARDFRAKGLKYCVMDVFSPLSSFLSKIQRRDDQGSLTIDGGVAVTLDDPRRDEKRIKSDENKNLFCVSGDISTLETRQEIKQLKNKLGIADDGFGVIIARPYGGARIAKGEEESIPLYYVFLQQAWELLSFNDGEMFIPVPDSLRNTQALHKWIDLMQSETGASVEVSKLQANMKITKHANSSSRLPSITLI